MQAGPASAGSAAGASTLARQPSGQRNRAHLALDLSKSPTAARSVYDKRGKGEWARGWAPARCHEEISVCCAVLRAEVVTAVGRATRQPSHLSDGGDSETVVKGVRRGSWEKITDPKIGVYYYCYTNDSSSWEAPPIFAAGVRALPRGVIVPLCPRDVASPSPITSLSLLVLLS